MINLIGIQPYQILYSRKAWKLRLWDATHVEEHCPKPNLLDMCLMSILGNDLLYCELPSTLDMLAQPNQAKSSPSEKLYLLKAIGETIAKGCLLLLSEAIALIWRNRFINFLVSWFFNSFYSPLLLPSPPSTLLLRLIYLNFLCMLFFDARLLSRTNLLLQVYMVLVYEKVWLLRDWSFMLASWDWIMGLLRVLWWLAYGLVVRRFHFVPYWLFT